MKMEQVWKLRDLAVPGDAVSLPGPRGGAVGSEDHVWKLFQADDDVPGLVTSMISGLVSGIDAATGNPVNLIVGFTPAAATDDAETIWWVKVSLELIVYSAFQKVWAISAAVAEKGAALPADTLDIPEGTDGDVHVRIGSVTAAAGVVTSITQVLRSALSFNLPPVLYGPETGKYVLTCEDGVIEWTELGAFECPPPPEE